MRSDLSQIHPLKRLTLIVLRCFLAASVIVAITVQFAWIAVIAETQIGAFRVLADQYGLTVSHTPRTTVSMFYFLCGPYSDVIDFAAAGWGYPDNRFRQYTLLWGLDVALRDDNRAAPTEWAFRIHHLLLIGTGAVLYFVTRERI